MKIHSVYDNPGYGDRYTVYFKGRGAIGEWDHRVRKRLRMCVGMSGRPFHPQGIGLHGEGLPGKHNGKRIKFEDLPADCQTLARQYLE